MAADDLPTDDAMTPADALNDSQKIKVNDHNTNGVHHHCLQPSNGARPSSSTKRKKKSNSKHANKRVKKQHHRHSGGVGGCGGGAHNNWIENCSESANRVLPKDCVAPLMCIITRAEIIDDDDHLNTKPSPLPSSLLPSDGEGPGESAERDVDAGVGGSVCNENELNCDQDRESKVRSLDDDGAGASLPDNIVSTSALAAENQSSSVSGASMSTPSTTKTPHHRISNIARPSASFLLQYSRNKVPFQLPSTVLVGEDTKQEKRLFIPVKRHVSATGPSKVRLFIRTTPIVLSCLSFLQNICF
jgi:hypothetical protein